MAGTEEGKSANRKTDLAVTNWVSGENPLLRWIPGVFITPGTYHINFSCEVFKRGCKSQN